MFPREQTQSHFRDHIDFQPQMHLDTAIKHFASYLSDIGAIISAVHRSTNRRPSRELVEQCIQSMKDQEAASIRHGKVWDDDIAVRSFRVTTIRNEPDQLLAAIKREHPEGYKDTTCKKH